MKGDTAQRLLPAATRLQEAIAKWELLAWYGRAADKKRAREVLPALRARLEIARKNNNAS